MQAGLSPLHVATFFSNYEIVELLVRKGASIDTVDRVRCSSVRINFFLFLNIQILCLFLTFYHLKCNFIVVYLPTYKN